MRFPPIRFAALSLAMLAAVSGLAAPALAAPTGGSDNVEVTLAPERASIAPGETIRVGLIQTIRPKWHTYWINPGDAGEPTRIAWSLPEGWSAGEIAWPMPEAITLGGVLTNYGYEGETILTTPITAPADARPGETVTLGASVTWLECEEICIPGSAELTLDLPVIAASGAGNGKQGADVAEAAARAPKAEGFEAGLTEAAEGAARLSVTQPAFAEALAAGAIREPYFFAYSSGAVVHNDPQVVTLGARGVSIDVSRGYELQKGLVPVAGVLAFDEKIDGRWTRRGVEINAEPGRVIDIGALGAGAGSGVGSASDSGAQSAAFGLVQALAFAFVGGLILNLMPCVFPVLSLKALGFAQKAHDAPGVVRRHGLAFLAGVLVSFLALAGALIALKAAGSAIGWGFQLQSPLVIAGLAVLMFVIGLNLLGLFEFGASLQGVGSGLADRGGDVGAFFTGVLAVLVATPCTAPFMGAALGFALTQPAWASLAIFAALGLGLAAPFVALSFAPGLLRALPKPGVWMERLKQFLAFPMFATAVWLVWTLSVQAGPGGVLAVLSLMTAAGFAIWAFKVTSGAKLGWLLLGRGAGLAAVVASVLGATAISGGASASGEGGTSLTEAARWSPERVAALRAEGRPVFVDFTAAWCITCQFNKKVAIQTDRAREAFEAAGVVVLTADWTNRDAVIARELEKHGRSGVPLYLVYGTEPEPEILPQLLTPDIIVAAVDRAVAD